MRVARRSEEEAAMAEESVAGYRLLKLMWSGQTSQVWEAVEGASLRHFAMKLLLHEKASIAAERAAFLNEAECGKQLAHPNIIRIVKSGMAPEPYILMEYFPAGNLRIRIQRKETEFLHQNAHSILMQAAMGLAFMHSRGWVHRDVKPDNMLVSAAGHLRLIDFALARRVPTFWARVFWRKTKPQGTRSYMSPEQIRAQPLDGRADIYSFACSAFELVAGRPPFRAGNMQDLLHKHLLEKPISPRELNREVTPEFAELILLMLSKKKEGRPRDFHEVLQRLRPMRVLNNVTQSPVPEY
jgi:serine/threonine protein kinase